MKLLLALILFSSTAFAAIELQGDFGSGWNAIATFDDNSGRASKIILAESNNLSFKIVVDGITFYGASVGDPQSGSGNVTYFGNGSAVGNNIDVILVSGDYYLFTIDFNNSNFWTIERITSFSVWYKNITDNNDENIVGLNQVIGTTSNWYLENISVVQGKRYEFAFLPNGTFFSNNGAAGGYNVSIVDFFSNDGFGYHDNAQDHKVREDPTTSTTYNVAVKIDSRDYEVITGSLSLPVELSSFTASIADNVVLLKWRTETEVNNYGFEVERAQSNFEFLPDRKAGRNSNFEMIGFVEGHGNSNSPKEYSFLDKNVQYGKYAYRLKQIDTDGSFSYSNVVEVFIGELPNGFVLEQNYPNPFNPSTKIRFAVDKSAHTTLKVYDALGSLVNVLFDETADARRIFEVELDASDLSSGLYYYILITGDYSATKKMLLVK